MFSNVLVGADGRQGGRDAVALATRLAPPDAATTIAQVDRPVGRGLHDLAERDGADLLVIGSSERGLLRRLFLGNHTVQSLNGAPCAVAIAPSGYAATPHPLATIGVGWDGSPESEQAVAAARELAARFGATVKALAVVSLQHIPYDEPIPDNWPEVAKELMDDQRRRLRGLDDVEADVSYGEPGEELWRFGEELDLLIVGSRGYGPISRLIHGSTSNYLARRAPCPLVVLPRGVVNVTRSRASERAEAAARS
jgi:nucleotide-binding universal stress UspA family protein